MAARRTGAKTTAAKPQRGKRARAGRVYGGRTPHERRQERRERVLMAALELFGTRGYADSTIEGICAEAGVGIRAFYDEFRTREELLRQVYDYAAGRAYDALEAAILDQPERPMPERVRTAFQALLDALLGDPRCGRVVCIESAALDRTLGPHRLATLKRFATLSISALPPATQARLPNPRLWATLLSGGINAVLTDWLISPVRPEIDELVDDLAELWLGTLPVT
ncbi:MAG: TetR/AcrR family transcriptional regulator [Thermoleophilia bacterium]|nr:TetR/AcrR family transcriptional regulator [Thermoleophilia bacterium]